MVRNLLALIKVVIISC